MFTRLPRSFNSFWAILMISHPCHHGTTHRQTERRWTSFSIRRYIAVSVAVRTLTSTLNMYVSASNIAPALPDAVQYSHPRTTIVHSPIYYLNSDPPCIDLVRNHEMSPSILSPRPRVPTIQHTISAPVEGSFTHLSHAPLESDKGRFTSPNVDGSTTLGTSMDKLVVAATLKSKRSPSISAPLEGSFRHVGHMEYDGDGGLAMRGVDPSWQAKIELLSDSSVDKANSNPRRPRRLSEPEIFSLNDRGTSSTEDDSESQPQLRSAPAKLNQPRTYQLHPSHHRPTQSHDYDIRVGRVFELRPRQQALADTQSRRSPRQNGSKLAPITRSASVTPPSRTIHPSQASAYQALASSFFDQIPKLSSPESTAVHGPGTDSKLVAHGNPFPAHRQRCISEMTSLAERPKVVGPQSPDGRSKRRIVHRKAVPKLNMDADEDDLQKASTESPRRRADPKGRRQQTPRPGMCTSYTLQRP